MAAMQLSKQLRVLEASEIETRHLRGYKTADSEGWHVYATVIQLNALLCCVCLERDSLQ